VIAVWLAFGGELFRLYYEVPGIGSLFRRSYKFLDIYAFAQSLLVGIAIAQLGAWLSLPRAALWRAAAWRAGIALGLAIAGLLAVMGRTQPVFLGVLGLLLAFGLAPGRRARFAALLGIVALQVLSLFFGVENRYVRPFHRPDYAADHARESRIDWVKQHAGAQRVYLSPSLWFMKQGTVQRMPVVTDYEPLALARYGEYFDFAAGRSVPSSPFNGRSFLSPATRWRLMDLTGTRYYVLNPWDLRMQGQIQKRVSSGEFRAIAESPRRLFERPGALPRVWVADRARVIPDPRAQLERLAAPDFDPLREVVLDATPARTPLPRAAAGPAPGSARITDYAPERVAVEVVAERPGLLVLSDVDYPGWEATLDGTPREILRADYLFRAVGVPAGRSEVVFRYRPASLRIGAALSAAGALAAGAWLATGPRRRASEYAKPGT
jgi:hypothetical protein